MKLRAFSITLLVLLVLGVIAYLSVRASVIAYLRGDRFRHNVEGATSHALRATSVFEPFSYSGASIYSGGLTATGVEGSPFASMRAEQLRADFDLDRVFRQAAEIKALTVQRLDVDLSGARAPRPDDGAKAAEREEPESRPLWLKRFLPQTVELKQVRVQETGLAWAGGALKGAILTAEQDGQTWQLGLSGGEIAQAGWPVVKLESARMRFNDPSLFINESTLTTANGGRASMDGEIAPGKGLNLHMTAAGVGVEPFLTPDWRARVHGALTGEARVETGWPPVSPRISGTAQLVDGRVEALPMLDQIALFTGSAQFHVLQLTKASGKFTWENGRLGVTELLLESGGLLRVEGGFRVVEGRIDGTLQVGVTANSLRWLPGSREKVFNISRDGYLWTPVRLTGDAQHPQEDLTARLANAAQEKVIEDAHGAVEKGAGTVIDILKAFAP